MDLNVAEPNVNYSMLRLQSENGIWEMGIYPTMYGTRVSCGRIGSDFYIKGGYCCGACGAFSQIESKCLCLIGNRLQDIGWFQRSLT